MPNTHQHQPKVQDMLDIGKQLVKMGLAREIDDHLISEQLQKCVRTQPPPDPEIIERLSEEALFMGLKPDLGDDSLDTSVLTSRLPPQVNRIKEATPARKPAYQPKKKPPNKGPVLITKPPDTITSPERKEVIKAAEELMKAGVPHDAQSFHDLSLSSTHNRETDTSIQSPLEKTDHATGGQVCDKPSESKVTTPPNLPPMEHSTPKSKSRRNDSDSKGSDSAISSCDSVGHKSQHAEAFNDQMAGDEVASSKNQTEAQQVCDSGIAYSVLHYCYSCGKNNMIIKQRNHFILSFLHG